MLLGSIILAGGRSRRMGRAKEALPLGDNTLLGRTVDTMLSCTHPVVVVARDAEQELPPLTLEADVVFDESPDGGPLVGMLAGLRAIAAHCDAAFVIGCDCPRLRPDDVDWLADRLGDHDMVIANIDGVLQPLGAIYRVRILPLLEQLLTDGIRTPRTLAERCDARVLCEAEVDAFDPARGFLTNLNCPEDYERARRQLED